MGDIKMGKILYFKKNQNFHENKVLETVKNIIDERYAHVPQGKDIHENVQMAHVFLLQCCEKVLFGPPQDLCKFIEDSHDMDVCLEDLLYVLLEENRMYFCLYELLSTADLKDHMAFFKALEKRFPGEEVALLTVALALKAIAFEK